MQIGPFTIARTKALAGQLAPVQGRGGWWPVIRESVTGAWQSNVEVRLVDVLTYAAVYACVTLIASDIGKLRIKLVSQDADGIWTETESSAFSPVLRKPNRYQTHIKFKEQWMTSKFIHGNTYAIKERDQRGVVVALYILDPQRVKALVAPDGAVYYQLDRDDLSSQPQDQVTVPAREIIHDVCVSLYHPLVGVSPISACGLAAVQGLRIQSNSALFFGNGSNPGGVLTAPGSIAQPTADRLKVYWDTNFSGANVGKVAVLGDGLKYESMSVNSVDSQLIEQLKWTAENVCTAFHVPPYMIGVGPPPSYNNIEALNQQYYAQALQNPIESLEVLLDEGLDLPKPLGTELDLDGLLRMDTATRVTAAQNAIGSGGMSPNEARFRYFDLGPVKGGETPYLQEQNWPLRLLAGRELPAKAPTQPEPIPTTTNDDVALKNMAAQFSMALQRKALEAGLYAA